MSDFYYQVWHIESANLIGEPTTPQALSELLEKMGPGSPVCVVVCHGDLCHFAIPPGKIKWFRGELQRMMKAGRTRHKIAANQKGP